MLYKFISISGNSIMSKSFFHGARRQGQPPPDRGVTVSSRSLLVCTKT